MIKKWFIGVNAKSKGYFTGFRTNYGNLDSPYYVNRLKGTTNIASDGRFTKQTALTKNYATEEDALDGIKEFRETCVKTANGAKQRLDTISKTDFNTMSDREKFNYIQTNYPRKPIYYEGTNAWRNYFYSKDYTFSQLSKEQIAGLQQFNMVEYSDFYKKLLVLMEKRLEFIDNLVVREEEIQFKYKAKEKMGVRWEESSENETNYNYCNVCGYAIPSIPKLMIRHITICGMCMSRLAEDTKIQETKISDEVREHYNSERFLTELG